MARRIKITIGARRARRGRQMRKGKGWRLAKGRRVFVGTLLGTHNLGSKRIAILVCSKNSVSFTGRSYSLVCTENINANVMVMKSAQDRV